jgi:hypothetical protein
MSAGVVPVLSRFKFKRFFPSFISFTRFPRNKNVGLVSHVKWPTTGKAKHCVFFYWNLPPSVHWETESMIWRKGMLQGLQLYYRHLYVQSLHRHLFYAKKYRIPLYSSIKCYIPSSHEEILKSSRAQNTRGIRWGSPIQQQFMNDDLTANKTNRISTGCLPDESGVWSTRDLLLLNDLRLVPPGWIRQHAVTYKLRSLVLTT